MKTDKQGAFYTPRDVAELLGVSLRTVYRLIARGELGPLGHIGKLAKLPREAVQAFVEKVKGDGRAPT